MACGGCAVRCMLAYRLFACLPVLSHLRKCICMVQLTADPLMHTYTKSLGKACIRSHCIYDPAARSNPNNHSYTKPTQANPKTKYRPRPPPSTLHATEKAGWMPRMTPMDARMDEKTHTAREAAYIRSAKVLHGVNFGHIRYTSYVTLPSPGSIFRIQADVPSAEIVGGHRAEGIEV